MGPAHQDPPARSARTGENASAATLAFRHKLCSVAASGLDTVSYALRPDGNDSADALSRLRLGRELVHQETGETMRVGPGPSGSVIIGKPLEGMRVGAFPSVGLLWAEGRLGAILAGSSEDHSLAPADSLVNGALRVRDALALVGLDFADSRAAIRRVDLAAELRFDRSGDGLSFLRAMASLEVPGVKRDVWFNGSRVETLYWRTPKRGAVRGRLYDKGVESGTDAPGHRLRLERQVRYPKAKQQTPAALSGSDLEALYCGRFEALERGSGNVIATGLNGAQAAILEKVKSGEITALRAERMLGTLVLLDHFGPTAWEKPYTAKRRQRELQELGIVLDPDRKEAAESVPVGELLAALIGSFRAN